MKEEEQMFVQYWYNTNEKYFHDERIKRHTV